MATLREAGVRPWSEEGFSVFNGRIADDATGPEDEVGVLITTYDDNTPFGPCRFPLAYSRDGSYLLPKRHDPCLVAFDDDGAAQLIRVFTDDDTSPGQSVRERLDSLEARI